MSRLERIAGGISFPQVLQQYSYHLGASAALRISSLRSCESSSLSKMRIPRDVILIDFPLVPGASSTKPKARKAAKTLWEPLLDGEYFHASLTTDSVWAV